MRIIEESELRQKVGLSQAAIAVVEDGFTALSEGRAEMPPIMRVDIPESRGEVDVKTAYIRGEKDFAIKISSGFFDNYRRGLPSAGGLMVVLSAETGVPVAVLLDNGYLTDVRTAAAGAIAAKYLAPAHIETAGVIGAGAQARWQMLALKEVRAFRRVLVYGPTRDRVDSYVAEMGPLLGVEVVAVDDPEAVVRNSDVVVTTTPAAAPLVKAAWLHAGLHLTAMGSDAAHKQEVEPEVLARADVLACDSKAQCFRLGELHHALEQGTLTREHAIVELGELTSGRKPGRTDQRHITVCDLTGTGVQDTMIALFALRHMEEGRLGAPN